MKHRLEGLRDEPPPRLRPGRKNLVGPGQVELLDIRKDKQAELHGALLLVSSAPAWRNRGSASKAGQVLRLGQARKLRRQLYGEFEFRLDQPPGHECAKIVSPHEFLKRRVQILERLAAHSSRQRAPDVVGEVAD